MWALYVSMDLRNNIPTCVKSFCLPLTYRQILMMVRMAVVRIVMMVMTTANLDFLPLSVMMFSTFMTFHHYHNR